MTQKKIQSYHREFKYYHLAWTFSTVHHHLQQELLLKVTESLHP